MRSTAATSYRALAGILTLCLSGCGERPASKLSINAIGIDENRTPVLLGLDITNSGKTAVLIDKCTAVVSSAFMVAGKVDQADIPKKLSIQADLANPALSKIAPGETVIVPVAVRWKVPPGLPLLAICQVQLQLRYDATFGVTSEPVVFVLAGSDETREAVLSGPYDGVEDTNKLADQIEALEGKKSKAVSRLLEALRGGGAGE